MIVKLKKSQNNEWGYVEGFDLYRYGTTGSTKLTLGVTSDGTFTTPYVFRGGLFVPLKQIDEEMGIEKYISAKKPFYSILKDGFIVRMLVGTDFISGDYLPEKSFYKVYSAAGITHIDSSSAEMAVREVREVPEQVLSLLVRLSEGVAACKGNREAFLRSRIK